jgi:hypothetical protein
MDMVERGKYFIINRPRQYGKTTVLFGLNDTLSKEADYLPLEMNFQVTKTQHALPCPSSLKPHKSTIIH